MIATSGRPPRSGTGPRAGIARKARPRAEFAVTGLCGFRSLARPASRRSPATERRCIGIGRSSRLRGDLRSRREGDVTRTAHGRVVCPRVRWPPQRGCDRQVRGRVSLRVGHGLGPDPIEVVGVAGNDRKGGYVRHVVRVTLDDVGRHKRQRGPPGNEGTLALRWSRERRPAINRCFARCG